MRDIDLEEQEDELETRVIDINRVYRVRKGGRALSFNALSAVGNVAAALAPSCSSKCV